LNGARKMVRDYSAIKLEVSFERVHKYVLKMNAFNSINIAALFRARTL
jgi:hypothetical protein